MKQSRPPRKGFTPFKENKSGKSTRSGDAKPAGKSFRDRDDKEGKPFGDKPKRTFGGDKEGKPFGDKPRRSFGGDKEGKPFGDKPRRTFGGDKEGKPFGDKPRRSFGGDKEGKPFGDKPRRTFGADKEGKSFGDKPPRKSFGDRDAKPFRSREENGDKPFRAKKDGTTFDKTAPADGERKPKKEREVKPGDKLFQHAFADGAPFKELRSRKGKPKDPKDIVEDKSFGEIADEKSYKELRGDKPRPRKSERKAAVHGSKSNKPKSTRKRIAVETPVELEGGDMPLNKFIAHCGICSRRKAVDYIKEGKVTVNGEVIVEPAFKVTGKESVKLNDKRIHLQKNLVYVLLNKPKGYITTTDDPEGRQTVMELVEDAAEERLYPVGRLDRNTSGLLLLTNDGELAQKLAHPKHNVKKIYHVELDKPLTKADFERILGGLELEDGLASVDSLAWVDTKDRAQIGIEIHSGKNRIVRRIFEHLDYKVEKLDRVMYAGLTKKNLNRGKWRFLSEKEVILLKHFK
ncbi:pseudouridine synthase [Chitinophaga caseinilytica]|uniref:Pseudouridine synthase n=1 Tax=Chitinophaga caseinilytica TaxID=2267521 RepID=A0ABZ2Z8Z3_9BACT